MIPPTKSPAHDPAAREPVADRAIRSVRTADDVDAAVLRMYGAPLESGGVIQVTSVFCRDDGALVVLEVGERTPRSRHDAFALGLARARADAIVTTGEILRAEPEMCHDYPGSVRRAAALAAWRRRRGRDRPPLSVVLTASGELDFAHPLFAGGQRILIYTTAETAEDLRLRAPASVGILPDPEPSPRAAIARLQGQGLATVVVEAGPSTARELYRPPLLVDELMLSTFDAPSLDPDLEAGVLIDQPTLASSFARHSAPYRVTTEDGEWRFSRHRR